MYEIDIKEIKSFIRASHFNSMEDPSFCFIQITEITNEVFLDNRARKVADAYKEDSEFNTLLSSLASICNKQNQQCDICPINKYCNHAINNCRQEAIQQNNLKMVDLFCGAGGLSLGFTQEGFITSLANDILDCCVDTYAHNHPETPRNRIIQGDIKEVVDSIENLLKGEKIDIVVGGPPCQGFSMANRQRLIDDPRNHLYKNFVQVVQKIAPPFFVMENVKGMLPVANQVIDDFSSIGYETKAKVLNARDFGVPQNRERLIYIGNRIGIDNQLVFDALEKTKKSIKKVVLEDALFGLKTLQASRKKNATDLESEETGFWIDANSSKTENDYIKLINQNKKYPLTLNHKARYNNDRDIEIYGRMLPGDKADDPKIADIMPYKSRKDIFKDKYFKLEPDKPCKTITAHMRFDCNMYIHPFQARGLTPREAARVQSYPDDYFFRGSMTKVYMQIGNSVPPLLGRVLAQNIKKFIPHDKKTQALQ